MPRTAIYSDLDPNLERGTDGDIKRQTGLSAIGNSLTNIVTTFQGERRMLQEFAVSIYEMLFEPIDETTAYILAERVLQAIEYWEPRVTITNFDIEPRPDDSLYRCRIVYQINDALGEEAELKFVLKAQ